MKFEQDGDLVTITDDGSKSIWVLDFFDENQAEFVARACNAHDKMVAALKELRRNTLRGDYGTTKDLDVIDAALTAAGAA